MSQQVDVISEIKNFVDHYRECVDNIVNTLRRLKDAEQLLAREEISRNVYDSLRMEYFTQLMPYIERYFKLKSRLREYKDRLQVLLTRLKLESNKDSTSRIASAINLYRIDSRYRFLANKSAKPAEGEVSSPIKSPAKLNISEIEAMLNELVRLESRIDVMDEISLLEEYLSISIKRNPNLDKSEWEQYLKTVMDRWSEVKSSYLRRLEDLEAKLNELSDAIRENEIRFAVGEYDHDTYNERRIALEKRLNSIKDEIETIQRNIESTDLRILRSLELLGGVKRG